MFRRCTARAPSDAELALLREALAAFRARYRGAPDDAAHLVEVGEAPLPAGVEPVELAAWTMVANALLNLDATIARS